MTKLPDSILPLAQKRRFGKDEFLFMAEDEALGFFYVIAGVIRVFKMDDQGREMEIVRIASGGFLAEAIIFAGSNYPFYAQSTSESEVLFFPRQLVLKRIGEDPELGEFFIRLLARKCVVLNTKIESLGLLTVKQRIARYLLDRCSGEKCCVVSLSAKKGEIAKSLGTINETLSRVLKQLQDDDIISVEGSTIHIRDCIRLKAELYK